METIYNTDLIYVRSGTSMSDARSMMKEKRIRHLPVVNPAGEITGMISQSDLSDVLKFGYMPVDLFASFPVRWVPEETPLSAVALMMIENKISSVLICNADNRAVGIITSDDLLYELSRVLKARESRENPEKGWDAYTTVTTAGEFFRKLSDIGI